MAFDFWEAQRKARSRTKIYVGLFILLTLLVAAGIELAIRSIEGADYHPPMPYLGLLFSGITTGVALFNYGMYSQFGGGYVAKSLGGVQLSSQETHPKLRQLVNIVEEMSVASGMAMPEVYLLPADQINAFAAGLTADKSAIAVTQGAVEKLNREELQGVVAHEFGHIYNGDMRITLQLAAMVMGFFIVFYLGLRLMQVAQFSSLGRSVGSSDEGGNGDNKRGGNPILLIAIAFLIAGLLTYFFGSLLKAAVSRQREFLADACAVQFTRNPQGIANALRRIREQVDRDMPQAGMAFSHLYIDDKGGCTSLFDTHPPLKKRIAAIEGLSYLPEEWKQDIVVPARTSGSRVVD